MNIILAVGILLIAVSLWFREYKPLIGFAFVFLIMGFQSNVEGDFMSYMEEFNAIAEGIEYDSRTLEAEPILPFLMRLCSHIGPFWLFVSAMSAFQTFVLVLFVDKFAIGNYKFIAAILFFFTFNMMLLQMKAMRQGLAVEFIVLSFIFIDKEKDDIIPWLSVLFAVVAYLTHNSSIIALPFLLLFYLASKNPQFLTNMGNDDSFPILMVVIYLFIYYLKTTILNTYLVRLALLDEEFRLASYLGEQELSLAFNISWLIVLYDGIIVFLVSWFYRYADSQMRVFIWASIIAAIGDMLLFGIGSLPRIIMYLTVINLIVYPAVIQKIDEEYGRLEAIAFSVLLFGYALKTSLPWIVGMEDARFGTYQFVFIN